MRGQDIPGMIERSAGQFGLAHAARVSTGPTRLQPRAGQPADKIFISGTAARFNRLSRDLGGFREVILPNAFGDLTGKDLSVTFGGNPSTVLGRTSSKTATVWSDSEGLSFEADPPSTPWADDLLVSLDRGDIDGAAAYFLVTDSRTEYHNGEKIRVITAATLLSLAVSAFNDYDLGTTSSTTKGNSKLNAAGSLYLPILQTRGRLQ